jgi:hypothetical protein
MHSPSKKRKTSKPDFVRREKATERWPFLLRRSRFPSARSGRREVFCSPVASPCGSRHRAALQRRLLRPLPQKTSRASPSRSVGARTPKEHGVASHACEMLRLWRARTSTSAHALRAASESRTRPFRSCVAGRASSSRELSARRRRAVTNPVGRRVRVSSQATTHERIGAPTPFKSD